MILEYFILNKSIILEKGTNDEYYLIDILCNRKKISYSDLKDKFNLSISFKLKIDEKINKDNIINILSNMNNKLFSINNNNILYEKLLDDIIKDFQYVELLSFQYFMDEALSEESASYLIYMEALIEKKKEGIISAQDFTKTLEDFKLKTSSKKLNALLFYTHLADLFEFVRGEIYHAEYRLKEINLRMMQLLLDNKDKLKDGIDYKTRGTYGDIISYEIEDTVKSIVSALDGISKILAHFSKIKDRLAKIKVPNVMHGKISSYKGIKNLKNPYIDNLHKKYDEMKLITLMRNDLTHSKSFQSIRQIIFYGRKTPCVLNYDLSYVDVLMWDYVKNGYFERSYEFNDFYTENNNMITFLHESYHKLFEILEITLKIIKFDIIELCQNNSTINCNNIANGYSYHTLGIETLTSIQKLDRYTFGKI